MCCIHVCIKIVDVNFGGLCSLYLHVCVDIIVHFISHSFVYVYYFYVVCTVVVSTFLRISLFGYEHDMCAFLGRLERYSP